LTYNQTSMVNLPSAWSCETPVKSKNEHSWSLWKVQVAIIERSDLDDCVIKYTFIYIHAQAVSAREMYIIIQSYWTELNSNTAVTAFSCPFTFRTKAYSTLYKVGHTALNFLQLPVIMGMFSSKLLKDAKLQIQCINVHMLSWGILLFSLLFGHSKALICDFITFV